MGVEHRSIVSNVIKIISIPLFRDISCCNEQKWEFLLFLLLFLQLLFFFVRVRNIHVPLVCIAHVHVVTPPVFFFFFCCCRFFGCCNYSTKKISFGTKASKSAADFSNMTHKCYTKNSEQKKIGQRIQNHVHIFTFWKFYKHKICYSLTSVPHICIYIVPIVRSLPRERVKDKREINKFKYLRRKIGNEYIGTTYVVECVHSKFINLILHRGVISFHLKYR